MWLDVIYCQVCSMKQIQRRSDARARPEGCAVRVYGDVPDCVLEHTCAQMRERWCVAVCSYWIPPPTRTNEQSQLRRNKQYCVAVINHGGCQSEKFYFNLLGSVLYCSLDVKYEYFGSLSISLDYTVPCQTIV